MKLKNTKSFFNEFGKLSISTFSASSAFYVFLSLVPIVILICSIVPYTSITQQDVNRFFSDIIPATTQPFFDNIIADIYQRSLVTISFSAIALIWSAGRAFSEINNGLNYIYGISTRKNFFIRRLRSSMFILAIILMIIISLFGMVFGRSIINIITANYPYTQPLFHVLSYLRFIIAMFVLFAIFLLIYKWGPNEKVPFISQIPGAAFSAFAWVVFSWLFSLYVEATGSFSSYGQLATIVIALFWLYSCMYIFFVGAYINRIFSRKIPVENNEDAEELD